MIKNNERWIWKNVHAFVRKQSGYGSICCEAEDLYQECVTYLLGKFRRSGQSAGEFKVSDLDLRKVMCRYIQSLLPVKVPKETMHFTQNMCRYRSKAVSEVPDGETVRMIEHSSWNHDMDDRDYYYDLSMLATHLDARDRRILSLIARGYSWSDISRITGISKVSLVRAKERIGKKYNLYMMEAHGMKCDA